MLCAPPVIYTFDAKYALLLIVQYVVKTRNLHMLQTFALDVYCIYLNAKQGFIFPLNLVHKYVRLS
jgi:hypothetical protein